MKPFLNKYILFLMIKSHYVRHNKAFIFFWSVRLQVEVTTKKIKNVQWEFSRWRNWLKRRFIWWWRRANHLPHYITRNILDFFCDALIHEIFISQKQELDLHRFVKTRYTTEYKIYHRVKFIKLSVQLDIVKGHICARSKANIRLGAGRKYALVPNKALSIGPWGVIMHY